MLALPVYIGHRVAVSSYLLDKHVKVLGELGGKTYKITLSAMTAQRQLKEDVSITPIYVCCFFPSLQPYASGIRTARLQDAQNAVTYFNQLARQFQQSPSIFFQFQRTSDNLDLGNTVGVTEDDTNLRGSSTLTGELADLLDDLLGGNLQPGGSGARVGEGAGRHALTLAVKSTHFDEVVL